MDAEPNGNGERPMTETGDVELVRRLWHTIWLDGALDELDRIIADPYVRHTRDGTETTTPAAYARHIASVVATFRGTSVDIHDTAVSGDRVFARLELHGVNLDTGAPMHITWLTEYRIADGRIAEAWTLHQTGLDW